MPNLGKTARRHGKHLRFWGCATPESHVAVGGGGGGEGTETKLFAGCWDVAESKTPEPAAATAKAGCTKTYSVGTKK